MAFIRIGLWLCMVICGILVIIPKRQRKRHLRQFRRYVWRYMG
jgi:hypothetical protein